MDAELTKTYVLVVVKPNGLGPATINVIGEFTSEANGVRWIEKEAPCLGEYQYYAVFPMWKKVF